MGVQTVWMVHLPGRTAEVVEVVALEQAVYGPGIVLVDDPVGDELPEKVSGSPSGCTGQRFPDGEGILVIAGELERPGRGDGNGRGLARVETASLGAK